MPEDLIHIVEYLRQIQISLDPANILAILYSRYRNRLLYEQSFINTTLYSTVYWFLLT